MNSVDRGHLITWSPVSPLHLRRGGGLEGHSRKRTTVHQDDTTTEKVPGTEGNRYRTMTGYYRRSGWCRSRVSLPDRGVTEGRPSTIRNRPGKSLLYFFSISRSFSLRVKNDTTLMEYLSRPSQVCWDKEKTVRTHQKRTNERCLNE